MRFLWMIHKFLKGEYTAGEGTEQDGEVERSVLEGLGEFVIFTTLTGTIKGDLRQLIPINVFVENQKGRSRPLTPPLGFF